MNTTPVFLDDTTLENLKSLGFEFDGAGDIRVDPRPGEGCPACGAIDHRIIEVGPEGMTSYRTCDEHGTRWPRP